MWSSSWASEQEHDAGNQQNSSLTNMLLYCNWTVFINRSISAFHHRARHMTFRFHCLGNFKAVFSQRVWFLLKECDMKGATADHSLHTTPREKSYVLVKNAVWKSSFNDDSQRKVNTWAVCVVNSFCPPFATPPLSLHTTHTPKRKKWCFAVSMCLDFLPPSQEQLSRHNNKQSHAGD